MQRVALLAFSAVLALSAAGCNRSQPHAHDHDGAHAQGGDHGHEHEEKTAQITVWTDRYEVFAEHKAPVAGKPTTFITHITDLQTSQPRREGPVKFLLRQENSAPIEHLQAAPARAGIYLPGLTFPKAGQWQVQLIVQDAFVDLGTIEVYASQDQALHAEIPEAPEGISFLKEQQWKILSRTEPVARREVNEQLRLTATVAAKPGTMASVTTPISGRLFLPRDKPLPVPGQKVQAGEVLALLQPTFSEQAARLLEAEAQAIRAKAAFDQARLAYERVKRLAAEKAKSERELQEAEFAFRSAEAEYEGASALQATYKRFSPQDQTGKVDLSLIELRAPIAGVISHVGSNLGEPVTPERALFTIINPESVWLEARVPEARLIQLQQTPSATLRLSDEQTLSAQFVYLGLQVEPSTRSTPIMFEAANPNQLLRIGQTIDLMVQTRRLESSIAIPESAVVEEDGKPIAFVQLSGETFDKRDLSLGIRGNGYVQVLDGLKEGERVATKGAYAIRLASVSSVIPAHGHAH